MFETTVTLTRDIVSEYQSAFLKKGRFQKMVIIYAVVVALFAAYVLLSPQKGGMRYLLLLAPVLLGWFVYKKVSNLASQEYMRYVSANNGEDLSVVYTIDETGINGVSGAQGNSMAFTYAQMTRVVETENLYVIFLKTHMVIPLAKAGFTKGTPEECKAWIESKIGV